MIVAVDDSDVAVVDSDVAVDDGCGLAMMDVGLR